MNSTDKVNAISWNNSLLTLPKRKPVVIFKYTNKRLIRATGLFADERFLTHTEHYDPESLNSFNTDHNMPSQAEQNFETMFICGCLTVNHVWPFNRLAVPSGRKVA